jgi:hypothetical protein
MTPAILAAGTDRRPSLGLAAAVAVEAASVTGAGTIMVEVGEDAQRRGGPDSGPPPAGTSAISPCPSPARTSPA